MFRMLSMFELLSFHMGGLILITDNVKKSSRKEFLSYQFFV